MRAGAHKAGCLAGKSVGSAGGLWGDSSGHASAAGENEGGDHLGVEVEAMMREMERVVGEGEQDL